MNGPIEAVPLRGVTIVTLEAMKPKALHVIRADDTTGKPVGMIEGGNEEREYSPRSSPAKESRGNVSYKRNRSPNRVRSDSSGSEGEKLCFECHNSEHLARECPNPLCYRCGVRGHRFYNCTKVNSWDRDYRRSGRSPDYMRDGHSRSYYERSPPHGGTREYASRVSSYRGSRNRNNQ